MMFGIGQAIKEMRNSERVCRSGWNGKGMWLFLVQQDEQMQEFIAMKTVQNTHVPWLASQTDLLANDWMVVK